MLTEYLPSTVEDIGQQESSHQPPDTTIPAAFYSDNEPPDPADDDPHWREFPNFESLRYRYLLVAGIVVGVLSATLIHLLVIFML